MKYWKNKFKIKLPKDKPERKRKLKELAAQYTDKKVTLYNSDAILIAVYGFMEQIKDLLSLFDINEVTIQKPKLTSNSKGYIIIGCNCLFKNLKAQTDQFL